MSSHIYFIFPSISQSSTLFRIITLLQSHLFLGAFALFLFWHYDAKINFSGWRRTRRMVTVIGNRPKYPCFLAIASWFFSLNPSDFLHGNYFNSSSPLSLLGGSPGPLHEFGSPSLRSDLFLSLHHYLNS